MKIKITGYVFALLLLASVALLFAGNSNNNTENRALASMPELGVKTFFSGAFASGTEAYINDHIGYRSEFIDASDRIKNTISITMPQGKVIRSDMDMGTGVKQASDLLVVGDTVMEMFADKRSCADEYAQAVSGYAKKLDKDIDIYLMLAPTRLEFEEPIYSNLQDSQKDEIDYIYKNTDERVKCINIYDSLEEHRDEYIYFRTDHHWTMLGAYYAYTAFCAQTGLNAVDIKDFKKGEVENFVGYLTAFAKTPAIEDNPDTIEWYDVNEKKNISWVSMTFDDNGKEKKYNSVLFDHTRNNYDFFLSADHPLACYTNKNLPDGETILIICDSYANVLVPWLMNNYKNVVMINPRSYKADLEYALDKYEPDDVMVMNYIFTTSFKDFCDILVKLY